MEGGYARGEEAQAGVAGAQGRQVGNGKRLAGIEQYPAPHQSDSVSKGPCRCRLLLPRAQQIADSVKSNTALVVGGGFVEDSALDGKAPSFGMGVFLLFCGVGAVSVWVWES